jgi:hypothetical protein
VVRLAVPGGSSEGGKWSGWRYLEGSVYGWQYLELKRMEMGWLKRLATWSTKGEGKEEMVNYPGSE